MIGIQILTIAQVLRTILLDRHHQGKGCYEEVVGMKQQISYEFLTGTTDLQLSCPLLGVSAASRIDYFLDFSL